MSSVLANILVFGIFVVLVLLFGVWFHWAKPLCAQDLNDEENENAIPQYVRPPEIKDLNCNSIFTMAEAAAEYSKKRIKFHEPEDPDSFPIDCKSIRQRHYFPKRRSLDRDADFPLAFVRIVYRDYRFLESEFAASFSPQNWYCFAVDSKASKSFHFRINALAACFPNVFVSRYEYRMDSAGHNVSASALECLRILQSMEWKYAILLQNHDIQLKTNEELVQIFKWMNGTNDVGAMRPPFERLSIGINWSFKSLHLFRNESRNRKTHNRMPPILRFAKSLFQSSLSREAVDFLLSELDLRRLMAAFEKGPFGVDELLWGSLNSHDGIAIPGGFTMECLRRGIEVGTLSRFTLWHDSVDCLSNIRRHRICVFGAEDLGPTLSSLPHLFANKMMPSRDFGAILCWHEEMFKRRYTEAGTHRLNESLYKRRPQVRFNAERFELGKQFRPSRFRCG